MVKATLLRRAVFGAAVGLSAAAFTYLAHSAAPASAATAPSISDSWPVRGLTKPSEDSKLAFSGAGVIDRVVVKAGDVVRKGQILATQDSKEEVATLAIQDHKAKSTKEVEAAQADLESKQVDLKRKRELNSELIAQGKTNSELDEAVVAVKIGQIAVEFRGESRDEEQLKLGLEKVKLEQKKLVSPIDGIIAKIDIHPGEGVDLSKPAIQVVQIDPLWIEVDIPSPQTKNLKVADPNHKDAKATKLQVRYLDEEAWSDATIIFLTPVADPGSNTRHVRLLMSNPNLREAGLPVMVRPVPDNQTAAAK